MFDALFPSHWSDIEKLMWLKILKGGTASYETITGNPVSFTAKAAPLRKLEVAFSPVQDLHGYDAPWPAGGGANIWDEEWEVGGIDNDTGLPDGTTQTWRSKNYIPVVPDTTYYLYKGTTYNLRYYWYGSDYSFISSSYSDRSGDLTAPSTAYYLKIRSTGSNPAYDNNVALNLPNTVHTYSPYSNLCPISGWSSLTVEQYGLNMLQLTGRRVVTTVSGSKRDFSEPSIYIGETPNNYHDAARVNSYSVSENSVTLNMRVASGYGIGFNVKVKPNTDYYGTYDGYESNTYTFGFYDEDGNYLGFKQYDARKFTTPDKCTNLMVVMRTFTTDEDVVFNKPYLTLGENPIEYVPYNPSSRSISISLGETVYSGYVDVISGVGEIDKVLIALTGEERGYTYRGDAANGLISCYWSRANPVHPMLAATPTPMCNMLKGVNGWSPSENQISVNISNGLPYCLFKATSIFPASDINAVKAKVAELYAAGTPLAFVGVLLEPIEIQLTPQEVESLAGDNTMWSDANGDLTVEYRSN